MPDPNAISLMQMPSIVLSLVAIVISYYAATRAYRWGLRPFLIFYNGKFDPSEETSWIVENAGNGPALNVMVAGASTLDITPETEAVVIPSLPKGHSSRVGWLSQRTVLVATYSDVLGRKYTTVCADNRTTVRNTNAYPFLKGVPVFHYLKAGAPPKQSRRRAAAP